MQNKSDENRNSEAYIVYYNYSHNYNEPYGVVAHLVERDIRIVEVGGSSPLGSRFHYPVFE